MKKIVKSLSVFLVSMLCLGTLAVNVFSQDTTPPTAPGTVKDGTGTDIAYTTSTIQLSANWTAAADADSGIAGYNYAIGTTPGATNITGWTSVGNVLSVTKSGLSLTVGTPYYFSVKAINGAGLESTATNSNGQRLHSTQDTTPPTAPAVVRDGIGIDIASTTIITQLSANWDAASDPESGIAKYWYAIGTIPGGTNAVNWTDNGTNTSVTKTGLSLVGGQTYYFSVKAENGVGLQSTVTSSDGQSIIGPKIVYKISGYIKDGDNNPIVGVDVKLNQAQMINSFAATQTNSAGYYELDWITHEDAVVYITIYPYMVVTPSKDGWVFTPGIRGYNPLTSDMTNQNFTGTKTSSDHKVDGHVKDDKGKVIVGVTVTLLTSNGLTTVATTVTDSNGYYVFVNVAAGTYKVKSEKPGYTFVTITITITITDLTGQDISGGTELSVEVKGKITVQQPKINPEKGEKSKIQYVIGNNREVDNTRKVHVKIRIYNINGELVKTVADEDMPYGAGEKEWNGRNFADEVTSSGVYLVRIEAGEFKDTKKIIVIK